MIEIKLSQGAKPGHGGILPGAKVTEEIAETRLRAGRQGRLLAHRTTRRSRRRSRCGVHRAAARALGRQAGRLQDLHRRAARVHGHRQGDDARPASTPTSSSSTAARAAPARRRWSSPTRIGAPLRRGPALRAQHARRRRHPRQDQASAPAARWSPASAIAASLALGADWCNSARGVHVLGRLHPGAALQHQPVPRRASTTQDPKLQRALDVPDKATRVHGFHKNTVHALAELVAAMGLDHTERAGRPRRQAHQRGADRESR